MATVQQILNDINLRYRNSFTTEQKIVWMNEEQRELFEILQLDSVPFSFSTVDGNYIYPIPNGVEKDRIKVMTIQVNDADPPDFTEIDYIENDNRQFVPYAQYWYTILENNFYINVPGGPLDDRLVYIYLDQQPEDISPTNLNVELSVPVRYQELLKLGVLKRIAAARKDVIMYNNYLSEHENKIIELEIKMKLQQPEFDSPIDTLPRTNRSRNGRYVRYLTINSTP
ncbi:phage adaptor protein [Paenibacillus naphthalenovorans]|uniref:phage adaptor protein n=1 Tax=Paenibacillus naphthalenovorans TaxID=162209 RepID=UPI00088B9839|nr:hypothetical protein [Paenibacillus naphthalenovorans]SDJ60576.1 hypothetical protein SAMN05421868_13415 [Paenibacillus naphthalenovorans]